MLFVPYMPYMKNYSRYDDGELFVNIETGKCIFYTWSEHPHNGNYYDKKKHILPIDKTLDSVIEDLEHKAEIKSFEELKIIQEKQFKKSAAEHLSKALSKISPC